MAAFRNELTSLSRVSLFDYLFLSILRALDFQFQRLIRAFAKVQRNLDIEDV